MPGRDRSGPMGMGPLTGRGMGPCGTGYGRGFGRGNGRFGGGSGRRGPGRGFGGGFGNGFAGGGWGYPVEAAYPAENEKDFLDREIDCLKSELEALEKRRESVKDD